jgi:hypothetical protein
MSKIGHSPSFEDLDLFKVLAGRDTRSHLTNQDQKNKCHAKPQSPALVPLFGIRLRAGSKRRRSRT